MSESPRSGRPRLPAVDVLRGLALVAMAVYHASWDLAYHGLVDWDVAGDPLWRGFAMAIAASFLALSGVGLVLAHRPVPDGAAFLARLARIAAAAGLVSLATYLVFPDAWIFFGVLHMIALGSVLALPLVNRPPVVAALLAVLVLALPAVLRGGILDAAPLAFLGLGTTAPATNDFVPVFPWFAAVLAGLVAGRMITGGVLRLSAAPPGTALGRGLAALGRWSLVVYLVHQPLLFALTGAVAGLLPADPATERARFVGDCQAGCGMEAAFCARFCACVAEALDGTTLFTVRGGDPDLGPLVSTAAQTCRAIELAPLPEAEGEE
jgi:uncharacterized membrane protein